MKSNSWIIIDKSTGKAIYETWDTKMLALINKDKYTYMNTYAYLTQLNEEIKEGEGTK